MVQLITDPDILKAWQESITPPPPSEEITPLTVDPAQAGAFVL